MKRKVSLLGVVLTWVVTNLSIQTATAADEPSAPDYRPFTLGVEAASTGVGLGGSWRFGDHFGARVGVNTFLFGSVDVGNREIEGINYDTSVKLMSEPLAVDIYPWKKSTFRITVGVLLNQNEVEGVVPQDPVFGQTFITIGGASYDSASIGDVNMKLEQKPVAPYVAIGMNFFLDSQKHWSVGGELGVAYTGTPDVTMSTSSGLVPQGDLNTESQQIEDGAWKLYPIVKVSLNYSF